MTEPAKPETEAASLGHRLTGLIYDVAGQVRERCRNGNDSFHAAYAMMIGDILQEAQKVHAEYIAFARRQYAAGKAAKS